MKIYIIWNNLQSDFFFLIRGDDAVHVLHEEGTVLVQLQPTLTNNSA